MNSKAQQDISRKLKVLNYTEKIGNISKTCRYFGLCRETFYKWRRAYSAQGENGLINNKPCPENHKLRIPKSIEDTTELKEKNTLKFQTRCKTIIVRSTSAPASDGLKS